VTQSTPLEGWRSQQQAWAIKHNSGIL